MRLLEDTQLLTVSEAALRLRQSERTVRDKIAAGQLPAVRIGQGPRAPIHVDAAELERFVLGPPPCRPVGVSDAEPARLLRQAHLQAVKRPIALGQAGGTGRRENA